MDSPNVALIERSAACSFASWVSDFDLSLSGIRERLEKIAERPVRSICKGGS